MSPSPLGKKGNLSYRDSRPTKGMLTLKRYSQEDSFFFFFKVGMPVILTRRVQGQSDLHRVNMHLNKKHMNVREEGRDGGKKEGREH